MEHVQRTEQIAPHLTIEDHESEFYLIVDGEAHDLTLSLDAAVADRLARFILSRRGLSAAEDSQ